MACFRLLHDDDDVWCMRSAALAERHIPPRTRLCQNLLNGPLGQKQT